MNDFLSRLAELLFSGKHEAEASLLVVLTTAIFTCVVTMFVRQ